MWNQVEQALNQSATNVVTEAASILPGAIALVASLVLAALLGWLLGFLVRFTLRAVDFDRQVSAHGWSDLAPWTGAASPTLLLARLVTWGVIFVGFLVGLAALDPTLTSQLANRLFGSAINLAMALIVLVVGNVLARFLAAERAHQPRQYERAAAAALQPRRQVAGPAALLRHGPRLSRHRPDRRDGVWDSVRRRRARPCARHRPSIERLRRLVTLATAGRKACRKAGSPPFRHL